MDRLYISIVILAMISLISFTTAWTPGLTGKYKYTPRDGYTCEWTECRKPGSGPRLFHVRCKMTDEVPYECVYKANPHCCKAYNKKQERYYESLARKSGENRATACDQAVLESDSMCQEVEFERIVYKKPSGNKWCIEDESGKESKEGQWKCTAAATSMRDYNKVILITFTIIASLAVMMFFSIE